MSRDSTGHAYAAHGHRSTAYSYAMHVDPWSLQLAPPLCRGAGHDPRSNKAVHMYMCAWVQLP